MDKDRLLADLKKELEPKQLDVLLTMGNVYFRERVETKLTILGPGSYLRENVTGWVAEIGHYLVVAVGMEGLANLPKDTHLLEPLDELDINVLVHRRGRVVSPRFLVSNAQTDMIVVIGELEPLAPHAILSSYDVGDRVVILEGSMQGQHGVVQVRGAAGVGIFYQLTEVGSFRRMGEHRADCLAAVFPDGDISRYTEIQPGHVRYPPGTKVVYSGEPGWVVLGWRNGLADLYHYDANLRGLRDDVIVQAEKRLIETYVLLGT